MTDRGVSTTLSYVLTLGITAVLISGLVLAAGGIVESQQRSVAREELRVIGQQLGARLLAADRLARAGGTAVRVEYAAAGTAGGSDYRIEIRGGDPVRISLNATDVDAAVTVTVPLRTTAVDTSVRGGSVEIVLTGAGELEVRKA